MVGDWPKLASRMYLVKSFLQSPTYLSAHLEHGSLYTQYSFKPIFSTFARFWETLAVKAGPLSDHKEKGNPNLGVYSWKNLLVTTEVVSISVGWTCTQPEEAYMKTNKNLNPRTVGKFLSNLLPNVLWSAFSWADSFKSISFPFRVHLCTCGTSGHMSLTRLSSWGM